MYGQAGQTSEGLNALTEALTLVEKTSERWYEAEIYRLKGELLLKQDSQKAKGKAQKAKVEQTQEEAEGYFQQALGIAQNQEAKSWELRAAMSLGRLWHQQGKTKERQLKLINWWQMFTVGLPRHLRRRIYERRRCYSESSNRAVS